MAKKYYDRLYVVSMPGGSRNKDWIKFIENVEGDLGGKNPDYGPSATRIVSHHTDSQTVHLLCTTGMDERSNVTIEEITRKTLKTFHAPFKDFIEKYFLPHREYPNIK